MEQLQPGQMLGAYRIINQVGQGGMATVYKAYQASMDRNVAIKVLPSQLAESKEFTQRFQQEARIIARLEHPHILPVFDYGESNGISYFVMRYLEAGTLKEKMGSGQPLPLNEIDRLFGQLADALSYAHSMGVIHRDLKPANALIDSRDNLFLTDFGIAKILEDASPRLTQTDAIMGTPAYISPEQAQAQKVDQRSDIYSLGIILYEMVTGQVPYTADTPLAVILKHVTHPLPLPSSVKTDIPEAIEHVLLKALAKNPDDRFATVAEFASTWKRALILKDTPPGRLDALTAPAPATVTPQIAFPIGTQSTPATVSTTAPKSGSSMRWVIGGLVGACLLLTAVGIFFFIKQGLPGFNPSSSQNPVFSGKATTEEFKIKIGDEIKNGEPGSGAGLIEAPGSKDVYTFTAEPGQQIYVHVIEQPVTTNSINFSMTDDLEFNVFFTCLECSDPGLVTLDRGGEYKLIVGNDDPVGAGTGAYRIKLWEVAPPEEFEISLDEEISRDTPATGAGYIENPGSHDLYTFSAEAGQAVYFQVVAQPKTGDVINWRVEDEAGTMLFDNCLQCSDPGLVTLDRGGLYTITVGNQNSHGVGTYAFKVWSVAPPAEFSINIGDTIAKDKPGSGAGFIETPGAQDIYTFSGTAGQIITLTLADMSLPEVSWRLEDVNGNELFNTCIQCGNPEPITLPEDGEYHIIVGYSTSSGTGAYGFKITAP